MTNSEIRTKQINCYVCGTWIKQNKDKEYCCPKCKAKYAIHTGKIVRVYDSYKEYIND